MDRHISIDREFTGGRLRERIATLVFLVSSLTRTRSSDAELVVVKDRSGSVLATEKDEGVNRW